MATKSNVELEFLGAAETVTGSRTILHHQGKRFLVDCGLFQGPRIIRERNWDEFPEPERVSAVLLTHAHIDHSGYLPKLVKEGFKGPIFSSRATAELCKIMLLDAAHLQEEDARFANREKYSSHKPALPLFETEDAEAAIRLLKPLEIHKTHNLAEGLAVELFRSGHILGSTYVQVRANDLKILFSGDIGNGRSRVLKPPEAPPASDVVIMEGTYGDRNQPRIDVFAELQQIINRVFSRGGTLIIPAFTVGRTQELLHLIGCLERDGKIPHVPVYLDSPMALDATELYLGHPEELQVHNGMGPLSCSNYHAVQSADESMLVCMSNDPKIVISAAGMLTGGRVLHHLKSKLPDEKSAVLFVGYQAEGTKGRLLRHGLRKVRIHHQPVDVEAEVLSIDTLSAHADSDDLMAWLVQLPEPQQILLNHGEKLALEALQYRIKTELGWSAKIILQNERIPL